MMPKMFGLSLIDFVRGLICLVLLEGAFYFFFPKVIQRFVLSLLADASVRTMRQFGFCLLVLGFVLAYLFRNG